MPTLNKDYYYYYSTATSTTITTILLFFPMKVIIDTIVIDVVFLSLFCQINKKSRIVRFLRQIKISDNKKLGHKNFGQFHFRTNICPKIKRPKFFVRVPS